MFYFKKDSQPVTIIIKGSEITSKTTMGVLGVLFDSKLQWIQHVALAIKKANNALSAIKLVKKYFNKTELLSIITANYYSRLYYNSEIWLLDSLHVRCKQLLLSASAKALKCCMYDPDPTLSYEKIHEMNNRASPEMFTHYKHALVLFKLYNNNTVEEEWISLNLQHQFSIRGNVFKVTRNNKLRVGNNIMINRMSILNNKKNHS